MREWLLTGAMLAASPAFAAALPVTDLNPMLSGFYLPGALLDHFDSTTLSVSSAFGNVSLDQQTAGESLQLDAEIQRWTLAYQRPLSDRYQLLLELPYVRLSGGSLDGFIESWHHTFNLPNGNRDQWAADRLWIRHTSRGATDYLLSAAAQGIGDASISIGYALGDQPTHRDMLWFGLKLPTGDAAELLGSGSTDIALSWVASRKLSARWQMQSEVSISLLGDGERMADQQRSLVWSGLLGSSLQLTNHWSAGVQLNAHTQVFDSALRALGRTLQLSFGPAYTNRHWQSQLVITEDLAVDTAPDVQFQLHIARRF